MLEEKILPNVVTITMEVLFDGMGCVNYDSNEQKDILFRKGFLRNGAKNDNFQFSKKFFTPIRDVDGNVRECFTHKVSSDCLKYDAFNKYEENVNILLMEEAYYTYLASMRALALGYVDLNRNKSALCRKSGVNLTAATECRCVGNHYEDVLRDTLDLELSTSCHHGYDFDSNHNIVDGKKTIIKKENIGKTLYHSRLAIEMKQLMFINCDHFTPLLNIETENKLFDEIYVPNVSEINGSNIKDTLGFHYLKSAQLGKYSAQYGMIISKSGINKMIMYILSSIAHLAIYRSSGAYFKFAKFLNVVVNLSDGTSRNLGDMSFEEISQYVFERDDMYLKLDEDCENEMMKHKINYSKKTKSKKNADSNED